MALTFDISNPPPSLADITREREQADNARAVLRKKNIAFLIFAVVLVIAILCFQLLVVVPSVQDIGAEPGFVGVVALYTPYVIFFIFVVVNTTHHMLVEKPRKILDTTTTALEDITPEELAEAIGSEQHVEITAYQEQVAAQGRSLVRAEIDTIKRWLDARRTTE
jgi:hypothetical protein